MVNPPRDLAVQLQSQRARFRVQFKIALALALNANTDRKNGTATNPYFSHYGGSWDPNQDSGTNKYRRGNHDNTLNPLSLAISSNVAQAAGLKLGGPVYVNGKYMGNYDDTVPEANTIDVYDLYQKDGRWYLTSSNGTLWLPDSRCGTRQLLCKIKLKRPGRDT